MAHKHYYLDESPAATVSISPRLKYTGSVSDDPNWFNIEHSHSFCEILYVLSGQGTVRIHGQEHPICGGDLRSCTNRQKPFQQSAKSGNGTNGLGRTDGYFIIFGKAAGVVDPGQRTLNDPSLGQDLPFRLDAYRNINAKP